MRKLVAVKHHGKFLIGKYLAREDGKEYVKMADGVFGFDRVYPIIRGGNKKEKKRICREVCVGDYLAPIGSHYNGYSGVVDGLDGNDEICMSESSGRDNDTRAFKLSVSYAKLGSNFPPGRTIVLLS